MDLKYNNHLLITKLQKPNLPEDLIHRKKLVDYLNENVSRPLTLISAGAGFGKSTTVSNWINEISYKNCWFSIDENDNDIRMFLSYLIAAIQTQIPNFGENIYRNIYSPNISSLKLLTNNLINDLNSLQEDILLVLDDFHNITNIEITNLISNILKYPLGKFHMAIISRTDPPLPLAKLRAGNKMKDIRSSHLRLSNEEIKLFIQNNFKNQDIDKVTNIFNNKFEGWVTGIRLLKIHFSYVDNSINEIERFINDNHLSETYFIEEIIKQIDKNTLKFLLQTSVLQKFNNELSSFILSENKRTFNSKGIIKGLLNKNLFLINFDNHSEWFRYHHLFQDALLKELKRTHSKNDILKIHTKAIEWYSDNGFYEDAFYHAAQTDDNEIIVDFVKENMYKPLNENKWFILERWLKHLPDNIINNCPVLLTAQMWVMQHKGLYWTIPALLDKIEDIKNKKIELYKSIEHQLIFFKAVLNFWNANIKESVKQFEYVKQNMGNDKLGAISLSAIYFASASQMTGKGEQTYKDYQFEITRNNLPKDYKIILLASLIYIKFLEGDLFTAERITERFHKQSSTLNNDFYRVWYEFFMGYITLQQYRTEEALLHYKKALKFVYFLNTHAPADTFAGALLSSKINNMTGDFEKIENQLSSFIFEGSNPAYTTIAYSLKTRLAILNNNLQEATSNFKKTDMTFNAETIIFNIEVPKITHCKLLLAKNTKQSINKAINKLTEIQKFTESTYNVPQTIEIFILLSVAFYKKNELTKAIDMLTRALGLAEKGHFVFPFAEQAKIVNDLLPKIKSNDENINEFINALIKTIPNNTTESKFSPKIRLSNREIDVINLLAQRFSNKEIAEKLFISPTTVKKHTINIYQKLDVNKRRNAVARAKEMGIIN